MTDLEMTEACWKAIGWRARLYWKYWRRLPYDPIHHYDQKCQLIDMFNLQCGGAPWHICGYDSKFAPHDAPRAICECVAKMQGAK